MSDADTDGTEIDSERDEAEAGAGGLRRAMEQRVKSLQDAEDRIRREQAALQEQAKVVFAEREARLARREKELAKREASITVSEGIADGAPHSSPDLEAREQAVAEAVPAKHSGAKQRQLAELEQTIASLEQQLAAATAVEDSSAVRSVDARQAELEDREHRAVKVEQVLQQKELHLDGARADLDEREAQVRQTETTLAEREKALLAREQQAAAALAKAEEENAAGKQRESDLLRQADELAAA